MDTDRGIDREYGNKKNDILGVKNPDGAISNSSDSCSTRVSNSPYDGTTRFEYAPT